MMTNIVSIFERCAEEKASAIAVTQGSQSYNYDTLNNYANFIAQQLLKRGVVSGEVVAITGDKSIEMIAGILAILKIGGCYMPIDTVLPKDRIALMLQNANCEFVLFNNTSTVKENIPEKFHIKLDYSDYTYSPSCKNLNIAVTPDTPAYIMHTSGSTGVPKGVIIPHRSPIRLVVNTNYIKINSSDSVLFHSNTSFDAGIFEIWAALLNGARIVISPYILGDLPGIYTLCQEENISILLLTTGLFHIFSNMDMRALTTLRYLVVGGDVMHRNAALKVIKSNPNLIIINGYGPAENGVFTTCHVIASEEDVGDPVSIGIPITGTQIFILDDHFQEVAENEIGTLYTGGLGLGLGYINSPELTAKKFLNNPRINHNALVYNTGDLVKRLSSGLIQFIGRKDNQVKMRDYLLDLTELETTLTTVDIVEDAYICVLQGEHARLAACLKISSSHAIDAELTQKYIHSKLSTLLPQHSIPNYFEFMYQFPMTKNGKIDRHALNDHLNTKYLFSTKSSHMLEN